MSRDSPRARTSGRRPPPSPRCGRGISSPIAALELRPDRSDLRPDHGQDRGDAGQEFGISRREQDEFALRSHQRAVAAAARGTFKEEIGPGLRRRRIRAGDERQRPAQNQTMEALAKLKPIFDRRDGTVTVGNSCQVTDGAAAVLAMERSRPREGHGAARLRARLRIRRPGSGADGPGAGFRDRQAARGRPA